MRREDRWAPPPALPTPFAVINHTRLQHNLTRMQALADKAGVALRPHIKTHKTTAIAAMQIHMGASGVTASKPSEAMPFLESGVPALLLAFPIVDAARVGALIAAALKTHTHLTFVLDSLRGVEALNQAGRQARRVLPVQIKVDVGLGRCGVAPDSAALVDLARMVEASPFLELTGLLSHAGHGYGAAGSEELTEIAEAERRQMIAARDRLAFLRQGLRLSVGSTPTVLAAADFSEIDEIRPGNYALLDLTAVRLGIAREHDIAFGIVATIVSRNENFYIIDAGSKTLSSDVGPHSSAGLAGYGRAIAIDRDDCVERFAVAKLSEEHGFVSREGPELEIGERLLVLPNHSCSAVALHDRLVVQRDDGFDFWTISARGAVT